MTSAAPPAVHGKWASAVTAILEEDDEEEEEEGEVTSALLPGEAQPMRRLGTSSITTPCTTVTRSTTCTKPLGEEEGAAIPSWCGTPAAATGEPTEEEPECRRMEAL